MEESLEFSGRIVVMLDEGTMWIFLSAFGIYVSILTSFDGNTILVGGVGTRSDFIDSTIESTLAKKFG